MTTEGSPVSARLAEAMAPEFYDHVYAPRLRDFGALFPYLSDVNKAHLVMLVRTGLVESRHARPLAKAMLRIDAEGAASIPLDPRREDAYFNYEAHLIARAGIASGGRLHIGRSRNDINATIDRMRARDLLLTLLEKLAATRVAALDQAALHLDTVMTGHTHLQPAQPITYGFYLAAIEAALSRDGDRLLDAYPRVDLSPMGAAALAGTGFAIDRTLVAELLGFRALAPNALDAVASRDFGVELLSGLSQLALTWSRIAQDYHVMVSHEFQTMELPDSLAATSSIMPQKKNPIALEHLRGAAGHILGYFTAAAASTKNVYFSNASDINRDGIRSLWPAMDESLRCLELLAVLLRKATPNAEVMLARARDDFSTMTDLADALVRSGLTFREAHHVVGAAVKIALDNKLTASAIDKAIMDMAASQQVDDPPMLSAADIAEALDPRSCVARRRSPGGTSPESVKAMIAAARASLDATCSSVKAHRQRLQAGRTRLAHDMAEIAAG